MASDERKRSSLRPPIRLLTEFVKRSSEEKREQR